MSNDYYHSLPEVILTVSGLCFSYADTPGVLRDITFSVHRGERVGLIGPNGSGKTTLFFAICGVLSPESGRVVLAGRPVAPGSFRPEIGLVFQQPDDQLFSPTVRDDLAFGPINMGLPPDEVEQRVSDALDSVGLRELAHRPPHHLSGGEKRMAAIGCVLTMRPQIILYDEPDANLDSRARRRLIRFLHASSAAALIASHDLLLIREVCHRVILLDAGAVAAEGETRTMLQDHALLATHGLEPPGC
jgi:cobalt/nickel transport system ATP-binding protein